MPQVSAAVLRSTPSITSAIASIRHAVRAHFAFPDAARSSAAVISHREIAIAPAIPASSASPAVSQTSADLGIPCRVKRQGRLV